MTAQPRLPAVHPELPWYTACTAVFAGGVIGTAARWATASLAPGVWELALVNGLGTCVLGLLSSALLTTDSSAPLSFWRLFAAVGFCGSLTTCSALGLRFADSGALAAAVGVVGFTVLGLLTAGLGWWLGGRLRRAGQS